MSVNGLDKPTVVEAYQSTLADPAGWLLLHYVSRDDLDVLHRGSGGWAELRGTLDAYEAPSPLYGFFLYRRRKILLKYMPEGTSRLLQVRTTVHFQAITNHFSPHDAVFSASAPGDLTETSLSATCSLHTEASLGSSDGSLRRRNLDEIAEDAEEPQSSNPQVTSILARLKANKLSREQNNLDLATTTAERPLESENDAYNSTLPGLGADDELSILPAPNQFASSGGKSPLLDGPGRHELMESLTSLSIRRERREVREARHRERHPDANRARAESPHLYPRNPRTRSPRRNLESLRSEFYESRHDIHDTRDIHEPSRPGTSDSKYSFLTWKPKKKLFPRPAEGESINRPSTVNSARQRLPAGMRSALSRGDTSPKVPRSERPPKSSRSKKAHDQDSIIESVYNKPELESPVRMIKPELVPERKPVPITQPSPMEETRSAVVPAAVIAPKSSESSMKTKAAALEKQRLMKALQQRNKKLTNVADGSTDITKVADSARKVPEEDPTKADSGIDFESGVNGTDKVAVSRDLSSHGLSNGIKAEEDASKSSAKLDPSAAISTAKTASDRAKKRRTNLKSINTSPALGYESEGLASDDSLMDELQNATVEEARRVSLPASGADSVPLSPIYSHGGKPSITSVRSVMHQGAPVQGSPGRNVEQATEVPPTASMITGGEHSPVKRVNVSSGISKRIKALAELSGRDHSAQSNYGQLDPPPSLYGARTSPIPNASQGSPSLERPSFSRNSTNQSGLRSIGTSQSNQQQTNVDMSSQSVSITARIVHAPRNPSPERLPSRGGQLAMELQQSEVTVEHDPHAHNRTPSKTSFHRIERPSSSTSRPDSRDSTFSSRTKQSLDHGFNFLGLRKGNDQNTATRSRRSPSIATLETVDEDVEGKRKSKKANIFKRMSGFGSSSTRKAATGTGVSSGGGDGSSKSAYRPTTAQRANAAWIVGDLNVQFPDTLLWKRRWVEVDPSGFLTLNSTIASERVRTTPRRYHLAEVKKPVVASQDGQELPHSILVDLINGGTLQLACEDPVSQGQVLRRLTDAHLAWIPQGA